MALSLWIKRALLAHAHPNACPKVGAHHQHLKEISAMWGEHIVHVHNHDAINMYKMLKMFCLIQHFPLPLLRLSESSQVHVSAKRHLI